MKYRCFFRCLLLFVVGMLLTNTVQAQIDTLFRYSSDQRIFKLWQTSYWHGFVGKDKLQAKDTLWLFPQLRRLQQLARQKGDERLYWYAELHKIIIRFHARAIEHKGLYVLDKAEVSLRSCPEPVVQASFWHYYGMRLYAKEHFDKGLRWMLRAQQAFEQIGYDNIPEINLYLKSLGIHFYRFEAYDKFLHYTEQAFRYTFLNRRDEVATSNNTAMVYLRLKAYSKADSLFRRTIRLACSYGDTTYQGIASGEYGRSLLQQGHIRKALSPLYTAYYLCRAEAPERSAISALDLATALLRLDSTAKAGRYIDSARAIQTPNRIWADYALAFYQTQALYQQKAGSYAQALAYRDSVILVKDSLRVLYSNRVVANSEIRINAERYQHNLKSLEAEKSTAILIRNVICIALFLITAAGGYALHQNRQKRLRERDILLEKQKRADEELAHATAQLHQHMSYLKEKNELIEKLVADRLQPADREPQRATEIPVEDLLRRTLLTEADWQRFKRLFEQVYPDFFDILQKQYPELTATDHRLLALSKLELPSKDMGFILGVSQESVRKARYRLRRKLEQSNTHTTLEDLLRLL